MYRSAAFAVGDPGAHACHRGFDADALWRLMTGGRPGGGHARHRHGHRGAPPWGFGGGGFQFGPPGGSWGRGRRARRGDVRTAALLLLAEEPRNGYQIMQALEDRSGGTWRPSPGSVYPALQQLEDEGLIRAEEADGRKLFQLTDAGRRYVEERGADRPAPWDELAGDVSEDAWALMGVARQVGMVLFQVLQHGSEAQRAEAQRILDAARRDLYRVLADGDPGQTDDAPGEAP